MAPLASISSEAQRVMVACFAEGLTDPAIAARIKAETNETVAERTIGRRKAAWREETQRRKAGREQMEDLLAAMKAGDHTASEMVNALAVEALMRDPDGTLSADPIALQQVSIQAERVRLQAKSMELKARQIALDEAKFAVLQEREKRAIALLNGQGKEDLSSDEIVRRVRQMYGMKTDDDSNGNS